MQSDELYEKLVDFISYEGLIINTKADDSLATACREICECVENQD